MAPNSLKILIIEDDDDIREILVSSLSSLTEQILALSSGLNIVSHLDDFKPDIVLVDEMMPDITGKEIIKTIRENSKYCMTPIMMVSGLFHEDQKVSAFDVGVDDYVSKPFTMKELVARVNALVRRAKSLHSLSTKILNFQNLSIDLTSHKVSIDGKPVQLTLTEYKILVELIKVPGNVLSRDCLREKALANMNVTDRTIDVHMAALRKKLNHLGDKIETVRGVGYRMAS